MKSGLIIASRLFLRCAVQSLSSAGKAIRFTAFFLFHLASICSSRKGMVIGAGSPPNLRIPKKIPKKTPKLNGGVQSGLCMRYALSLELSPNFVNHSTMAGQLTF